MKYLFTVLGVFAFVLSGCASIIPQEDIQNEPASGEIQQEITSSGSESDMSSPGIDVEVVGGDDASLREFIKQWLLPVYPDGSSDIMTVYIASIPKDVPYDLPAPDDARTIGSITGGWVDYLLMFDTGLDINAIHEFYAQALADKGWQEAPINQGGGGFVSQSNQYQGFCQEDGKAYLSIETPSISEAKTAIRLSLDTSPDSYMCNPDNPNQGISHENLIPQLKAPEGALVQGGGSGGSDKDAEISASIKSDLSSTELVEFYNEQLLAAGWEMQNTSSGDGAAWSNWRLKDEQGVNWIGSLLVVKSAPDKDALFALLRIIKDE